MDRRTFLRLHLFGVSILITRPAWIHAAPKSTITKRPDIVIANDSPAAATRLAVKELGGMSRFVKKGQRVVIKPNMSFAQGPETATNTHPEVIKEIVKMCKEAGASKIRVVDHPLQDAEQSLLKSGIQAACDSVEKGICYQVMGERNYQTAKIPLGGEMKSNQFMKEVLEADVLIAAPVCKSHASTGGVAFFKRTNGINSGSSEHAFDI